jgi:hypothetical protein
VVTETVLGVPVLVPTVTDLLVIATRQRP